MTAPEEIGATAAEKLSRFLLAAGEGTAPVLDAVAGYRAKLLEAGWSERAAEAMAVQYHGMLLGIFSQQLARATRRRPT